MCVAVRAADLGPSHEPRAVFMLAHCIRVERLPEARPSGTGIIFRTRGEQRRSAADTAVHALALLVPTRPGERPLGAVFSGHVILRGCKLRPPFALRFDDLR